MYSSGADPGEIYVLQESVEGSNLAGNQETVNSLLKMSTNPGQEQIMNRLDYKTSIIVVSRYH
jgi:hypothetical protein